MEDKYKPVWTLIMFDLPVQTRNERYEARMYRKQLIDNGFSMVQLSVYVRYTPNVASALPALKRLEKHLPSEGKIRIIYLTDQQWSRSIKIWNSKVYNNEKTPEQLQIF